MEPYLPSSTARTPPGETHGAAGAAPPSRTHRLTCALLQSYLRIAPPSERGLLERWRDHATAPREDGAQPKAPRRVLTQPCDGITNDGCDNAEAELICYTGDVLGPGGEGPAFEVLDKLGRGSFGQVFRCRSRKTGRLVAIKIIKNCRSYAAQAYVESQMARALHARDPHPHIVHLFGDFSHRHHVCLVFELLGMNLYELLKQNQFRGLPLRSVRLASCQVISALERLATMRVMHCDLKPENILVESGSTPTRFKIIDLGSACVEGRTAQQYVQSRFYRAPEVLIAAPYDGAVDVWSAACVFAELFLGLPLFPGASTHDQISRVADMLGPQPDELLARGDDTLKYFASVRPGSPPSPRLCHRRPPFRDSLDESVESLHALDFDDDGTDVCDPDDAFYRLKSAEQYAREKGSGPRPKTKKYFQYKALKDIVAHYPVRAGLTVEETLREKRTRATFAHFLAGMLDQLPHRRWTPLQTARHPFLAGGDVQSWAPCRDPRADERRLLQRRRPPARPGPALRNHAMDSSAPGYRSGARIELRSTVPSSAMDRTEPGRRPSAMDRSDSSTSSRYGPHNPFLTPPPVSGGIGSHVGPHQTYRPYWPGQLPAQPPFPPLRRNATMTQAQMAHAQWETTRARPYEAPQLASASYTAGYHAQQQAAESYDFSHALQRPHQAPQQQGYPYQLRRSDSLRRADSLGTPPPPAPRLNPGSLAFAPRLPPQPGMHYAAPAQYGYYAAPAQRAHPNSPGMHYAAPPQYGYYAAPPQMPPPPHLTQPPPPQILGSSPPLNMPRPDNGHNRSRRGGRRGNK